MQGRSYQTQQWKNTLQNTSSLSSLFTGKHELKWNISCAAISYLYLGVFHRWQKLSEMLPRSCNMVFYFCCILPLFSESSINKRNMTYSLRMETFKRQNSPSPPSWQACFVVSYSSGDVQFCTVVEWKYVHLLISG